MSFCLKGLSSVISIFSKSSSLKKQNDDETTSLVSDLILINLLIICFPPFVYDTSISFFIYLSTVIVQINKKNLKCKFSDKFVSSFCEQTKYSENSRGGELCECSDNFKRVLTLELWEN